MGNALDQHPLSSKEALNSLACAFRRAVELHAAHARTSKLQHFPRGACSITSLIFGLLLLEQYDVSEEQIRIYRGSWKGDDEEHEWPHEWLQVRLADGQWMIVDLTADQFADSGTAPVMVSDGSAWHDRWTQSRPHTRGGPDSDWVWSARHQVQRQLEEVSSDYLALLRALGLRPRSDGDVIERLRVSPYTEAEKARIEEAGAQAVLDLMMGFEVDG